VCVQGAALFQLLPAASGYMLGSSAVRTCLCWFCVHPPYGGSTPYGVDCWLAGQALTTTRRCGCCQCGAAVNVGVNAAVNVVCAAVRELQPVVLLMLGWLWCQSPYEGVYVWVEVDMFDEC